MKFSFRTGVSVVALVIVFLRNRLNVYQNQLKKKYKGFRDDFQAEYEMINNEFHHHDVTVNGIKWHYVDEGPKDGPVVLFMHGYPESWYSWRYVLPLIDKSYRLIAIDMKGYGRSEKSGDDFTWATVARETKDFMVQGLQIDKFYVVSHDWGTLIGSVMVHDYQSHILGYVRMQVDLILPPDYHTFSIYKTFKMRPQFLLFQTEYIAKLVMQDPVKLLDTIYLPRLTSAFKEVDKKYLMYEFSKPDAFIVYKYFRIQSWDFETAIRSICQNSYSFPVLQLEADRDPTQPVELFANVEKECPRVEMRWIYNASHFSNFDQPETVASAINHFLARTSSNAKK